MSRATPATLAAILIVSGCLGAAPAEPLPADEPIGPRVLSTAAVFDRCTGSCYEPSIAVDPMGRIFVTEVSGRQIATSTDGTNFTPIAAPPNPGLSLDGGRGDALLSIGPDGRLWYLALAGEFNGGTLRYRGIQVASSPDGGATWTTNTLISRLQDPRSAAQFADRPWLAFGANNDVYLSWFDALYVNQASLYPGAYELFFARSDDGGKTFGPSRNVHSLVPDRQGATGGAPVVDATGRLIIPYFTFPIMGGGPAPTVRVAVSTDRGNTFEDRVVSTLAGSRFAALAVAPDDTLAFAWNGPGGRLRVSSSTDHGTTWTPPTGWNETAQPMTASPWIGARPNGTIDVLWYARTGAATQTDLILASGPAPTSDQSVATSSLAIATAIPGFGSFGVNTDFAHASPMPNGDLAVVWSDAETLQAYVALVHRT